MAKALASLARTLGTIAKALASLAIAPGSPPDALRPVPL
jgi:hypothetical protein